MPQSQSPKQAPNELAKQLHKLALEAQKNSYSPYSHKKVGASLILGNGKTYSGANIENASYGATICAERTAIFKAISENPGAKIKEICVVTDAKPAWAPCGLCRQVLVEFTSPDALVHIAGTGSIEKTISMKELVPLAFSPEDLKN